MLEDIVYSLRKAQEGKFSLHEQRALDRECRAIPLTQEEEFVWSKPEGDSGVARS